MTDNELLLAISDIVQSQTTPIMQNLEMLTAEYKETRSLLEDLTEEHKSTRSLLNETRSLLEDLTEEHKETRSLLEDLTEEHKETRSLLEDLVEEHREEAHKNLETRLLIENEVIPRLQNIESCYTSTYQRYADGILQIDSLQGDVDVLKLVAADHSEQLKRLSHN